MRLDSVVLFAFFGWFRGHVSSPRPKFHKIFVVRTRTTVLVSVGNLLIDHNSTTPKQLPLTPYTFDFTAVAPHWTRAQETKPQAKPQSLREIFFLPQLKPTPPKNLNLHALPSSHGSRGRHRQGNRVGSPLDPHAAQKHEPTPTSQTSDLRFGRLRRQVLEGPRVLGERRNTGQTSCAGKIARGGHGLVEATQKTWDPAPASARRHIADLFRSDGKYVRRLGF